MGLRPRVGCLPHPRWRWSALHRGQQKPPRPHWTPRGVSYVHHHCLLPPLQSIERDQRAKAEGVKNLDEFEPNDLNYEGRLLENSFLFSGISFNLATETGEDAASFEPLAKRVSGSCLVSGWGVSDPWCALSSVQKPG